MREWPTLFQKNTAGTAIKMWSIAAAGAVIIMRHGQLGGAIQETRDEVKVGKNLGKKNATTPETQAEAEAQSKYDAKRGEGYVADLERAHRGEVDADKVEGGVAPMLAHPFGEKADKVEYPVMMQRKLDGFRCTSITTVIGGGNGAIRAAHTTLWSRERKAISFPRLQNALAALFLAAKLPAGAYELDGELFAKKYRRLFPKLASAVRNQADDVELWLYDFVSPLGFEERVEFVRALTHEPLRQAAGAEAIVFVEPTKIENEAAVHAYVDAAVADGDEGGMVRQLGRGYEAGKRSTQLLKVKKWQDAEFRVVGHKEGRGKLKGCPIWICDAGNGATFDVKQDGPIADLRAMWPARGSFVGRSLTVKYFEKTPDGLPRFPVGLRFVESI